MDADLVLEGGGVKGIALVGAISVLEERGYRFHRVAGTSAGAIAGALVAAGIPATRMREIMRALNYLDFRDARGLSRFGPLGKGLSLLTHRGIYAGDYLRDWLREVLDEAGVRTFADLRSQDPGASTTPGRDHRLVVMASDLSQGALRRLPWDYERYGSEADDVDVVDAVRASMSIPFFYRPVKLHDEVEEADCWLVDGGLLSNFPVGVFDRRDGRRPRWPTFGIKLSTREDALQGVRHDVRGVFSMTSAMFSTLLGFHDRAHLEDASVVARTIFVDTMKVRATDFDLDLPTAERLFRNGRDAAQRFLDGTEDRPGWDFDAYVERFRSEPSEGTPSDP